MSLPFSSISGLAVAQRPRCVLFLIEQGRLPRSYSNVRSARSHIAVPRSSLTVFSENRRPGNYEPPPRRGGRCRVGVTADNTLFLKGCVPPPCNKYHVNASQTHNHYLGRTLDTIPSSPASATFLAGDPSSLRETYCRLARQSVTTKCRLTLS